MALDAFNSRNLTMDCVIKTKACHIVFASQGDVTAHDSNGKLVDIEGCGWTPIKHVSRPVHPFTANIRLAALPTLRNDPGLMFIVLVETAVPVYAVLKVWVNLLLRCAVLCCAVLCCGQRDHAVLHSLLPRSLFEFRTKS
jgi:hypothetical protein